LHPFQRVRRSTDWPNPNTERLPRRAIQDARMSQAHVVLLCPDNAIIKTGSALGVGRDY
jgi:hypothetical protein